MSTERRFGSAVVQMPIIIMSAMSFILVFFFCILYSSQSNHCSRRTSAPALTRLDWLWILIRCRFSWDISSSLVIQHVWASHLPRTDKHLPLYFCGCGLIFFLFILNLLSCSFFSSFVFLKSHTYVLFFWNQIWNSLPGRLFWKLVNYFYTISPPPAKKKSTKLWGFL